MQPKFYEVILATRQTAHLINLRLSINSLINCYHSRAWKTHQQVHGSLLETKIPTTFFNSVPQSLPSSSPGPLGNLWWLVSFDFKGSLSPTLFFLFCLFHCFLLTFHTSDSWETMVPRQTLVGSTYVSSISICYGISGWAIWPTSSFAYSCVGISEQPDYAGKPGNSKARGRSNLEHTQRMGAFPSTRGLCYKYLCG